MTFDNEARELQDEENAQYGDPRKCPEHGEVMSDPFGLFDAPCSACEAEMYEDDINAEFDALSPEDQQKQLDAWGAAADEEEAKFQEYMASNDCPF